MTNDSEETRRLGEERSDDEPRTLEWDGITQRTSNSDWLLAERDRRPSRSFVLPYCARFGPSLVSSGTDIAGKNSTVWTCST